MDPQKALQLSGALQDFWDMRGYTSEGYQWLSESLRVHPMRRRLSVAGLWLEPDCFACASAG